MKFHSRKVELWGMKSWFFSLNSFSSNFFSFGRHFSLTCSLHFQSVSHSHWILLRCWTQKRQFVGVSMWADDRTIRWNELNTYLLLSNLLKLDYDLVVCSVLQTRSFVVVHSLCVCEFSDYPLSNLYQLLITARLKLSSSKSLFSHPKSFLFFSLLFFFLRLPSLHSLSLELEPNKEIHFQITLKSNLFLHFI